MPNTSNTNFAALSDKRENSADPTPSMFQKLNHDLRSPLSAVLGFATLLDDDTLTAEERADYVAAVKRAAEQMLTTLNGIQPVAASVRTSAAADTRLKVPELLKFKRVLLADDEPRLRQLTQFCLEKGGATVVAAADGQEAVDLALAGEFDVILMDMQMPVLDGFEASKLLRERGYTGPIVAFTAHASPQEWERCLSVGCTRYVSKPFEAEKLVRELAAAIEEPAPAA